jgi:hypothetical protein
LLVDLFEEQLMVTILSMGMQVRNFTTHGQPGISYRAALYLWCLLYLVFNHVSPFGNSLELCDPFTQQGREIVLVT